ncbi:MAG: right-handed parallel beta-helix repeat-containing protein [archaeon]
MLGTKRVTSVLLVVFVLLSVVSHLGAVNAKPKTIVVPDDYNDIQEAINNANPGDTVYVKNGTYYFEGPSTETPLDGITINKSISLIGESSQSTIFMPKYKWTGRLRSFIHVIADNVLISGFTMIGTIEEVQYRDMARKFTGYVQRGIFLHTTDFVSPDPQGCKIIGNIFIGYNSEAIGDNSKGAIISENQFLHEPKSSNGISLTYASDTIIVNNTFYSNGIGVGESENITIKQNQIIGGGFDNTTTQGHATISLGGKKIYFYENNITNCGVGISFSGITNCQIYNNTIANNKLGIILRNYISNTDNSLDNSNIVYHNDFLNNENHVFVDNTYFSHISPVSGNTTDTVLWDYNKIGNYWDDYDGKDSNQDKIGDIPYVFDVKNQDNYPLMEQFEFIEIKTNPSTECPFWLVILTAAVIICATAMIYLKTQKK